VAAAALVLFLVLEAEVTLLSNQVHLSATGFSSRPADRTGDDPRRGSDGGVADRPVAVASHPGDPRQVRASLDDGAIARCRPRRFARAGAGTAGGVKAFVTGSLARLSGAYTLSVQLVAAHSGEALVSCARPRRTLRDRSR
jgi:hypothetical protein